jgi:hypothetical protein
MSKSVSCVSGMAAALRMKTGRPSRDGIGERYRIDVAAFAMSVE